jgi:PAS domain S-box-containing protein
VGTPIERVLREGVVVGLANQTLLIAKDGTERPVADSGAPIRNENGESAGVVLVFRDQTEERAAQTALLESERKFRETVEHLDEGYYCCTPDGWVLEHNLAFNRILGFDAAQDMRGAKLPEFWQNPDDRRAYLNELMTQGSIKNYLIHAKTAHGDKVVVMANSHLETDEHGGLLRIVGTFTDFTQQHALEADLRGSEAKYRSLFDNAEVGMYRSRLDGSGIVALNQRLADLFGFTKEEMMASPATIRWADPGAREAMVRLVREQGELRDYEIDIVTKGGEVRRTLASVKLYPHEGYLEGTAVDITERKRAEERILHLNTVLKAIRDVNQIIVREKDAETLIRRACDTLTETRGYSSAWIALFDDSGRFLTAASAGLGSSFESLVDRIRSGRLAGCDCALRECGVHVVKDPVVECPDCPVATLYRNQSAIGIRLEHGGRVRGQLVVSMDADLVGVAEEQHLIAEVADDIAYALHSLDVERQHHAAEGSLRESEERFRSTFEQAAVGISHVGTDGCWLRVNQRLCDIVGYTRAELLRKTFQDITHPDDLEADLACVHQILAGEIETYSIEKRYIRKDRSVVPIKLTVSLVRGPSGEPKHFISIVEDITERKRAEEEIHTLNAELEQRVLDRTAQLEESNKELEAFSYSVSHDLRAPLRAIDGFTRILLDTYEPQLNTEGKRVCSVIRHNTAKMSQLIDDLLAFSRVGRAEMICSRIDMGSMAKSVFYELTTPESRDRIDFRVGTVPPAVGDPTLMRQVWINLLDNAIKFSSKRPRAIIEVLGEHRQDETVYSVRDNGAGFEKQYVHKLFGVFQRLHNTREFEGTGVGLAIVQRVARRHGGHVWAEGESDQGATFHFALPQQGA